jgi:hypothetical protein
MQTGNFKSDVAFQNHLDIKMINYYDPILLVDLLPSIRLPQHFIKET